MIHKCASRVVRVNGDSVSDHTNGAREARRPSPKNRRDKDRKALVRNRIRTLWITKKKKKIIRVIYTSCGWAFFGNIYFEHFSWRLQSVLETTRSTSPLSSESVARNSCVARSGNSFSFFPNAVAKNGRICSHKLRGGGGGWSIVVSVMIDEKIDHCWCSGLRYFSWGQRELDITAGDR